MRKEGRARAALPVVALFVLLAGGTLPAGGCVGVCEEERDPYRARHHFFPERPWEDRCTAVTAFDVIRAVDEHDPKAVASP